MQQKAARRRLILEGVNGLVDLSYEKCDDANVEFGKFPPHNVRNGTKNLVLVI
jgi:hypothetical protein